jgi:hypothetical protein
MINLEKFDISVVKHLENLFQKSFIKHCEFKDVNTWMNISINFCIATNARVNELEKCAFIFIHKFLQN